jgi:hypothetical protein
MAHHSWQMAGIGPAAIAIHDDRNVLWHRVDLWDHQG